MSYQHLYRRLTTELRWRLPQASKPQAQNLALLTLALAFSPNCHLATLATILPVPGQRENSIQRVRRWLDNQAITQQHSYLSLVRQLFAD